MNVSKYIRNYNYEFQSTLLGTNEALHHLLHKSDMWDYSVRSVRRYLTGTYELDKSILKAEKKNVPCDVLVGILKILTSSTLSIDLYAWLNLTNKYEAQLLQFLRDEALSLQSLISPSSHSESEVFLESACNVLFALEVLSIVFQYLIGYIDRGGTKTYNSGSLEFRATYVSLLLFQGAYVWIKFRDVAPKRTVYPRSRRNRSSTLKCTYEPRFKPPREKDVVTGEVLKFNCLPLGEYDTHQDAEVVCQIAGYYYGKDTRIVALDDGFQFQIPQMSEQERSLCGQEKRKWVSVKAKQVYEGFKRVYEGFIREEAARRQSRSSTLSADAGEQVGAGEYDFADQAQAVAFSAADTNTEDEIAGFRSEPAQGDGSMVISDAVNAEDRVDAYISLEELEGIPTMQDIFVPPQLYLLKEQLEADFRRRYDEQHQQHLQQLEEQKVELRRELEAEFNERTAEMQRENEQMKSTLNQVLKPLSVYFATCTEI